MPIDDPAVNGTVVAPFTQNTQQTSYSTTTEDLLDKIATGIQTLVQNSQTTTPPPTVQKSHLQATFLNPTENFNVAGNEEKRIRFNNLVAIGTEIEGVMTSGAYDSYTIKKAGVYQINAKLFTKILSTAMDTQHLKMTIKVTKADNTFVEYVDKFHNSSSATAYYMREALRLSIALNLALNDKIEIFLYNASTNTGGLTNVAENYLTITQL